MDQDTLIILGAVFFGGLLLKAMCSSSPPKKKEYPQSFKDKIAIENLKGTIDPKDLAVRENITTAEVEQFTKEFLEDAQAFAESRRAMEERIGRLEMDCEWFEKTCARFIGSDWKSKTGYDKRDR
ncbi:MAG: hypothetical protein IJ071_09370 [Ruminococcus sp.]|nr:hypothetical protein [Ruminococcus sp.]